MKQLPSILSSLLAILACGGLGVFISNTIISVLGWQGALAAFATLLLSMFLAFAFFVVGAVLLRILRSRKTERGKVDTDN